MLSIKVCHDTTTELNRDRTKGKQNRKKKKTERNIKRRKGEKEKAENKNEIGNKNNGQDMTVFGFGKLLPGLLRQ